MVREERTTRAFPHRRYPVVAVRLSPRDLPREEKKNNIESIDAIDAIDAIENIDFLKNLKNLKYLKPLKSSFIHQHRCMAGNDGGCFGA